MPRQIHWAATERATGSVLRVLPVLQALPVLRTALLAGPDGPLDGPLDEGLASPLGELGPNERAGGAGKRGAAGALRAA